MMEVVVTTGYGYDKKNFSAQSYWIKSGAIRHAKL